MILDVGIAPVVVLTLLYIITQLLLGNSRNIEEHLVLIRSDNVLIKEELERNSELDLHWQWAQCYNQTETIEDPTVRQVARNRCVPPPNKRGDQGAYLFTSPGETAVAVKKQDSTSASSARRAIVQVVEAAEEKINPRKAEAIAAEQERKHRVALCRQTPIDQRASPSCDDL